MINITYIYVKRKIFLFSNENIVDVDILIALIIFIHVDEESVFDFILVFIRGPEISIVHQVHLHRCYIVFFIQTQCVCYYIIFLLLYEDSIIYFRVLTMNLFHILTNLKTLVLFAKVIDGILSIARLIGIFYFFKVVLNIVFRS